MPKKRKPFIDKKNSVTFRLAHRSQHDPLTADETAPQRVLVPINNDKPAKIAKDVKTKEEEIKYGIYFDDNYDYLQHLRNVDKTNVEWIEVPSKSNSNTSKLNLPSCLFASEVEEKVGLLNKAAPESGLRLDLDPDIVAAMDEDFDYSNPDNILEDDFMELVRESASGPDHSSEEDSEYSSEMDDEVRSLEEFDSKSRFTDYSMSSSVVSRNSQLTMVDDSFEQMFSSYDDVEIGGLECEEIEGDLDANCPMFEDAAKEFKKYYEKEMLTVDINRLQLSSSEESDEENNYLLEIKEKEKWDCESILSTYSTLYNHPKLIKEPVNRIRVNKKTGIPIEKCRLTKQALSQLDNINETKIFCDEDQSTMAGENRKKELEEKKIGKETLEEKKLRKRQLKELRRERRMERKANATAFKEEKKKMEKTLVHNKLNRPGIAL